MKKVRIETPHDDSERYDYPNTEVAPTDKVEAKQVGADNLIKPDNHHVKFAQGVVWERTYEQRAKRYRSIAAKKSQELDQVVPRSKTAVRTVNSESSKKEDALAEVVSAEVFLFNGSASSHRSTLELPILVDT